MSAMNAVCANGDGRPVAGEIVYWIGIRSFVCRECAETARWNPKPLSVADLKEAFYVMGPFQ